MHLSNLFEFSHNPNIFSSQFFSHTAGKVSNILEWAKSHHVFQALPGG